MATAQFEEKEYEAPLYSQLQFGSQLLWSPGQVFENCIGIDRAMHTLNPYFWNDLYGYEKPFSGVFLSRLHMNEIWGKKKVNKELPNFKLNLFIQAKRCEFITRAPRTVKNKGLAGPLYKFSIDLDQQKVLAKVFSKMIGRALVVYAAPVFWTEKDLYKHTRMESIVEHSNFPSASKLQNHSFWYYNTPGATGVAHSEPEYIEQSPIFQRIETFSERYKSEQYTWEQNLRSLVDNIVTSLSDEGLEESFRRSHFFQIIQSIGYFLNTINEENMVYKDFLVINAFCHVYKLNWLVIG